MYKSTLSNNIFKWVLKYAFKMINARLKIPQYYISK